jgi:hypothetical protein
MTYSRLRRVSPSKKKEPHKTSPYIVIWGVTCIVMGIIILSSNHETATYRGAVGGSSDTRTPVPSCYQPGFGGIAP